MTAKSLIFLEASTKPQGTKFNLFDEVFWSHRQRWHFALFGPSFFLNRKTFFLSKNQTQGLQSRLEARSAVLK